MADLFCLRSGRWVFLIVVGFCMSSAPALSGLSQFVIMVRYKKKKFKLQERNFSYEIICLEFRILIFVCSVILQRNLKNNSKLSKIEQNIFQL